jgi:folylpolyglutamate synthase/dihydropteroate synthase
MIRTICESGIFDGYIITKLDSHRALMPEVIKEEFERYTKEPVILEQNVKAALERIFAMQEKEDVWFAAGSLYLVGEIKALL